MDGSDVERSCWGEESVVVSQFAMKLKLQPAIVVSWVDFGA